MTHRSNLMTDAMVLISPYYHEAIPATAGISTCARCQTLAYDTEIG